MNINKNAPISVIYKNRIKQEQDNQILMQKIQLYVGTDFYYNITPPEK